MAHGTSGVGCAQRLSSHNDVQSLDRTMGVAPGTSMLSQVIVSSPVVVAVINTVVGGVIGAIMAQQLGFATPWVIAAGVLGSVLVIALLSFYTRRDISASLAAYQPLFPAPASNPAEENSPAD